MTIEALLKEKREEILRIAAKHGARNVRVFGSLARGEAPPSSGAADSPRRGIPLWPRPSRPS
jgi:predicted nucleotidyltransferase